MGLGLEPFTNVGTIEINAASSIRVFVDAGPDRSSPTPCSAVLITSNIGSPGRIDYTVLGQICEALGRPGDTMKISGVGDVESAVPSMAMWRLGRQIAAAMSRPAGRWLQRIRSPTLTHTNGRIAVRGL